MDMTWARSPMIYDLLQNLSLLWYYDCQVWKDRPLGHPDIQGKVGLSHVMKVNLCLQNVVEEMLKLETSSLQCTEWSNERSDV